jgi:hypothetical protein
MKQKRQRRIPKNQELSIKTSKNEATKEERIAKKQRRMKQKRE